MILSSCSQFQQHFTNCFSPMSYHQKKKFTQSLSTKNLSSEKATHKMFSILTKSTSWGLYCDAMVIKTALGSQYILH